MILDAFIASHASAIRLGSFLGVFALMALWEILSPRRPCSTSRRARWTGNLELLVLNSLLLRLIFPAAAVGAAVFATAHGWGLLGLAH
ncbi:fatty acid hydroxylase, partial [mine drainage metagenome]